MRIISKYPLTSKIIKIIGTMTKESTQTNEYRLVAATESTHWKMWSMNAMKKTLPIARITGEGRLSGNGNAKNISPAIRMIAMSRSSQKFSLRDKTL